MARAKRTDRAEARRRYRAEQAIIDGRDDGGVDAPERRPRRDAGAARRARPPRPRIGLADRVPPVVPPARLRGDLRALPRSSARRPCGSRSLLTLAQRRRRRRRRPRVGPTSGHRRPCFLFQYFLHTPAIGGVFLAGFLAPRASWLLGVIVGLVSARPATRSCPDRAIRPIAGARRARLARTWSSAAFLLSPIMGALFASAAAWYRRFLYLSNPNRGRRRAGKPRRGDRTAATRSRGRESEGRRPPLTPRSAQSPHPGVAHLADAAGLIRAAGRRRPPRGVAGPRGRRG